MARPQAEEISSAGQDSFLDVVTNIVGILIILVMVVGGRVGQMGLNAAPKAAARVGELEHEVGQLEIELATAENEIAEVAAQGRRVELAAAMAADARLQLATAVSAAKLEVELRKRTADGAHVRAAESAARRKELEVEIEKCSLELEGLSHLPATTKEVLAYPTPIGRTVTGDELHFRLDAGRIAYIPLTELFEMAKAQTQRKGGGAIASLNNRIETVGPVQGFSLDYVIEARIDQARGQVLIRSREWVVRPMAGQLGETPDEALRPGSKFSRVLANITPETAVTLWCYPDSFEAFRTVREELHRRGLPAAGRPMPEGAPIGGSADGSKSVVQ
jgi:hypothetical protein